MKIKYLVLIAFLAFIGGAYLLPPSNQIELPKPATNIISAPRTTEEENTIAVYKKTNQAVIFISTVSMTVDPFDWFPQYKQQQGSGSGIIIDAKNGIVLTNLHVISNAQKIEIFLSDSKSYQAKLLGMDASSDLAVLQIIDPPAEIFDIQLGDSDLLEVGQRVFAIGNPFGLNRTLTTGIVSSLDRTLKTAENTYLKGLIQTDAAINPGNSGGPLLDSNGNLIGINTVILSQSGDSAGIGFAIPINRIRKILPELIKNGKILRPDFGWVLADTNQGPVVRRVFPDSPAAQAEVQGLERHISKGYLQSFYLDYQSADLIYKIGGERVNNKLEVENLIEKLEPEETLEFEFRRGGINGTPKIIKLKPEWR